MMRFSRCQMVFRLGLVAACAFLAFSNPGHTDAQDPNLKPNFGSVTLKSGFAPDPFVKELVAGGPIQTKLGGVITHVDKAPDFSLNYTAGVLPLTIYVESKADTTLLINLPDGKWVADDDSGGNLNPLIKFAKPKSGRYDIFVGTVGKDLAKATLKITELK